MIFSNLTLTNRVFSGQTNSWYYLLHLAQSHGPYASSFSAVRSSFGFDSEDLNRPPYILAHLQGTQIPDAKANLA